MHHLPCNVVHVVVLLLLYIDSRMVSAELPIFSKAASSLAGYFAKVIGHQSICGCAAV